MSPHLAGTIAAMKTTLLTLALCAATLCWAEDGPYSRTKLLAHRGVSQHYGRSGLTAQTCTADRILAPTHGYLENTIDSMRAAFAYGADVVELDIHPTTDGEFVVFHDWTVDCRTEGHGVTRQQTLAYLKSLDIGHGYTHDGGATFPFRGKFKGAMPTWDEVMTALPGRRFLVNIKSRSAAEGAAAVAYARAHGYDARLIAFSGDETPMGAIRQAWPGMRTGSPQRLKSCFVHYLLIGWSGHVPDACRDSVLYVPINYTWAAWGWPQRYVERMAAANSEVFVVGHFERGKDLPGIPELEDHRALPPDFEGGILTDRIEVVGPAVRAR